MLAMDLPILRFHAAGSGDDAKEGASGDGASKAAGEGTSSAGSRPGGDSGGDAQSQGGAAAGEAGARWSQAELAEVVGDEELLARWRMENPEQARAAPPPPHLPVFGPDRSRSRRGNVVRHARWPVDAGGWPPPSLQRPPSLPAPCHAGCLARRRDPRGGVRGGAPARQRPLPGRGGAVWAARARRGGGGGAHGGQLGSLHPGGGGLGPGAVCGLRRHRVPSGGQGAHPGARRAGEQQGRGQAGRDVGGVGGDGWSGTPPRAAGASARLHFLMHPVPPSPCLTLPASFTLPPRPCWPSPSCRLPLQESLYAEVASWANPHELEQQLAKAAERRKRALTGEELRQVKQRKQEMKEKKRTAWLFT